MTKENQSEAESKDLLATLGGPIGILESLVPGTVYVSIFSLTFDVLLAASIAGSIAFVFAIIQLVRKRPLTQVFAGLVGLAISIYLPLRDGLANTHAADYFVPGLLTNVAYALAFAISLLIRKPLAAIALSFLSAKGKAWKTDRQIYKRYYWITVMWCAMFLTRLLIEVPLYLANQVPALGVAKLVLGTPFYALIVWFSWLMARGSLSSSK